jgi:hypothetical protein
VFELSINELRLAKLAIHQVFFRTMESFEAKNHESLVTIAENILKQAADDISTFDTLTDDMGMVRVDSNVQVSFGTCSSGMVLLMCT